MKLVQHKEWIHFRIDNMTDEQKAKLQAFIVSEKPLRYLSNQVSLLGIYGYNIKEDRVDL